MKIKARNKMNLMKASLGTIDSDLVITNVQLVNVITGEIYPAHVYIYDGFISHVETKDFEHIKAKEIYDGKGKYLIPGFIDAHVHIESSMMTPSNFASAIIPFGTTTIVTDPHEIANVCGKEGVYYMHDIGNDLPMRQLIDIPSCVPAVLGLENSGAVFTSKEIEELSQLERCSGLAEVMDYVGVIEQDKRMMDILDVMERKGLYIQGHAPCVSGRELSTYLCGGANTCHEVEVKEEALEKLRNGMYVDACDSSIVKNVKAIVQGIKDNVRLYDYLCFCSDDREADEIKTKGHMNDIVRNAIASGLDPIIAIKCATLNVAREIHIDNLGAIAPNFVADMQLVDDLYELIPTSVFYGGQLVAENGKMVVEIPSTKHPLENKNTMFVKELCEDDFIIRSDVENGKVKVNIIEYESMNSSNTILIQKELEVKNHIVQLNDPHLKYAAVMNRHKDKDTMTLAIVKNFGTQCGALASTIAHDSHNLVIVYDTPINALLAANTLKMCGGGMCAVKDEKVIHTLELPLAGLMSLKKADDLIIDSKKMKEAINQLGLIDIHNPLLRIVTLCLPVIPYVKMSDLGIIDVLNKKIIPLMVEV